MTSSSSEGRGNALRRMEKTGLERWIEATSYVCTQDLVLDVQGAQCEVQFLCKRKSRVVKQPEQRVGAR